MDSINIFGLTFNLKKNEENEIIFKAVYQYFKPTSRNILAYTQVIDLHSLDWTCMESPPTAKITNASQKP